MGVAPAGQEDGGPGQDTTFAAVVGCLCCTLGGLAKSLGLPQLKLAWMLVTGAADVVGAVVVDDGSASSPEQAAIATARPRTQLNTRRSFTVQSYRAFLFAHVLVAVF